MTAFVTGFLITVGLVGAVTTGCWLADRAHAARQRADAPIRALREGVRR